MIQISIVVPLFNESNIIKELIHRIKTNTEIITKEYEIILVDDGSKDDTWEKITLESTKQKSIKGIKLSRNFGQHYAITAGLHDAHGKWVIVMDGDLQDRPEVIPNLVNKAEQGFDIVFVSRQNRPESLPYLLLQKLFYVILRSLSGINFDSSQANFSIISQKVVKAFRTFPEGSRFYPSTIKWLGFSSSTISADHGNRYAGKPSYTFVSRLKLAFGIILSFSLKPLRLAILVGSTMSILSMIAAIWIIVNSVKVGFLINGWASIMTSIFFSTGLVLIMLGIIGIYIGEIFSQVKNRPLYVVESTLNISAKE